MREDVRELKDLLRRVRSEFLEMPGLALTPKQAQRLLALDERTCAAVFTTLLEARFLARTRTGEYVLHGVR
jgi:hypothetical protein